MTARTRSYFPRMSSTCAAKTRRERAIHVLLNLGFSVAHWGSVYYVSTDFQSVRASASARAPIEISAPVVAIHGLRALEACGALATLLRERMERLHAQDVSILRNASPEKGGAT